MLAFEQGDDYDGGHFLWFRSRFEQHIYIDRVALAARRRRLRISSDGPNNWADLASFAK
jgi:predicted GNAT superfamily acetyltransferase